jgi:hypothetical protein
VIRHALVRTLLLSTFLLLAGQPARAGQAMPAAVPGTVLLTAPSGAGPLPGLIDKARVSVLVETRALNDPQIGDALRSARTRGLDVRVMADPHSASSGPVLAALAGAGVLTRRGNPAFTLTGESALILDRTTLLLGNAPLTIEARTGQRRFFAVDFDPADVLQATAVFYDDWERRPPSLFGDNTVLAPVNYAAGAAAAINRAVYSLDLMAGSLDSPSLVSALADASHRQVAVRVLLDPGAPLAMVQSLQLAGASVRLLREGFAGSAIAVDNARLLLGSASLTDYSLQQNRELGLVLKVPEVSAMFAQTFGALWRGTAPIAAPTLTPTPAPTSTPTSTPRPTATPRGYHPSRTPTPRPTTPVPTPTVPRRTPTAVPTSPPTSLGLAITYNPSVRIGSRQQIVVRTIPGATVSVVVTYPDGTVTNPGTRAGLADASGRFTDSWPISLTVNIGPAKASIVVSGIGRRKSQTVNFVITF